MKISCYAIFFLQRLNLFLRGYIILDRTRSFHRSLGDPPENLLKLFVCKKLYHLQNYTKNPAFYAVNAWNPLSILERIWWLTIILLLKIIKGQTRGWGSLIMKVLWSPIYYKIEGNYFKGKIWVLYKLKRKTSGKVKKLQFCSFLSHL